MAAPDEATCRTRASVTEHLTLLAYQVTAHGAVGDLAAVTVPEPSAAVADRRKLSVIRTVVRLAPARPFSRPWTNFPR